MESAAAAAFGSIFTGGGGAPMIFNRWRRRHKKDRRRSAAANHLQEVYKNTIQGEYYSHPVYYTLRLEMTYYVSSGTLNSTNSHVYYTCIAQEAERL